MVQPLWKTVQRSLKKLKTELSYDIAIPILGIYLKKMKTLIRKGMCTTIFIAALFTTAKTEKQPKRPSTDEWINKMWYRASLVAQWLRNHLPMQGPWVAALVREDPTRRGATKSMHHNY